MSMRFSSSSIPKDSSLRDWLYGLSNLETPYSYLLAGAISATGAMLKRNTWIDQGEFKVFPNLSILLVGPSGIGKDTALDRAEEVLQRVDNIKNVTSRTIEGLYYRLSLQGVPAAGYMVAGEISDLTGRKDYQSGLIQGITNILSNKSYIDYNLKHEECRIKEPTLTCMFGSTVEWLQSAMPDGTQEGGFFPRLLIVCEVRPRRQVPLPKYDFTTAELSDRKVAKEVFFERVETAIKEWAGRPGEMFLSSDAKDWYRNWYFNRFKYFSSTLRDYANRSRDQILRVAMISAVLSNRHAIEIEDLSFAHHLITYAADRLISVVKPRPLTDKVAEEYLLAIGEKGTPQASIIGMLRRSFDFKDIQSAERSLLASKEISIEHRAGGLVCFKKGEQSLKKESD